MDRRNYSSDDDDSFIIFYLGDEEASRRRYRPLWNEKRKQPQQNLAVNYGRRFFGANILFLMAITILYSFILVPQNGSEIVTATTATVDDCSAKHIHLAQRNNVNEIGRVSMTVSFAVDVQCRSIIPSISYGRESFQEEESVIVVTESPLQFNYTSQYGMFDSDWLYHVELPDLVAGEEMYWYQITSSRSSDRKTRRRRSSVASHSKKIPFRTPPLPGHPTAFALVGDLGQTDHSLRTMLHIKNAAHNNNNNHPISHLIVAGDMSYADSDPTRWPSWFQLMEPLLQTTPTHVAAGNHEIECNTNTRAIFVPYEHYFYNPNRIRDGQMNPITDEYRDSLWNQSCSTPSEFLGYYVYGNSFYAYRHGLVHVIVLNSYTYSMFGSEQYTWLEEELRLRFDRSVTPWLLVVFHCPFYTTFDSHVDEAQSRNMKYSMESLFVQYGVNWVVSGHDHAYLRTRSMKYGQVDSTQKAPVYLIVGAGGNREGHPNGYRQDQPELWVAKRTILDWGYGHWWIPNATHAHLAWVQDGFAMEDVRDDVWFVNPHVASYQ